MKARAPPFERDPGVPAEGVPPRRYCRSPTRLRTSALYGAEAPSGRARRRARAIACPHVLPRAKTPTPSPQCSSPFLRRALGGGEAPIYSQTGANPPTLPRQLPLQGHRGITGLPTRRPVVPRVVPVVCFNMIKSYAHDWLLLGRCLSSLPSGRTSPERQRRANGDRRGPDGRGQVRVGRRGGPERYHLAPLPRQARRAQRARRADERLCRGHHHLSGHDDHLPARGV